MDYPCRYCKDRYLGCHAKCEKYQKVKKENDARRIKRQLKENFEYL